MKLPMTGRRAKVLAFSFAIPTFAAGILALAILQLRMQGSSVTGGSAVADYPAAAETENHPAPDFELPSLDGGEPIVLSSFHGNVLVLNFWASWCAPCRLEAPALRRVAEAYRERGVRFLGVDYSDADAAGLAFVDEFDLPYPSVSDTDGALEDDYGLIGFPTTFIIDDRGTIRYRFVGYVDEDVLRASLDEVLSTGPT